MVNWTNCFHIDYLTSYSGIAQWTLEEGWILESVDTRIVERWT